ncbi:MAG: ferritin-like domain-containing protein [Sphingomonas sp.]|uniref:ferritin-like domain-containing protein n=1 Tax=Sphingomonas sp. TaxID=28214 RepID=UPI003F39A6D6
MTDLPQDSGAQLLERLEAGAERRSERREFFRTALGAGAIAAVGAAAVTLGSRAMADTTSDTNLLNILLNFEYLEAQFYAFAVTGAGLPSAQLAPGSASTTTVGAVTGGKQVSFTDPLVAKYAREIANEKAAQVAFLRTTLGAAVVAKPAIDIGSTATSAFSVAMRAANVVASGVAFDPYASDENFLLSAFFMEDVVVTAYKAAAQLISTPAYRDAGAGLLAAHAHHAALIRTVLYTKGATTAALRTQADAISAVRDTLDGTTKDDVGISPAAIASSQLAALNGLIASNIVPAGTDGIAYGRLVANVLNIFYLNSLAVTKGGFYPNGLNATVVTSAAN